MQKDTLEGISEDILSTFESVAQRLDLLDACDAEMVRSRMCRADQQSAHTSHAGIGFHPAVSGSCGRRAGASLDVALASQHLRFVTQFHIFAGDALIGRSFPLRFDRAGCTVIGPFVPTAEYDPEIHADGYQRRNQAAHVSVQSQGTRPRARCLFRPWTFASTI